MDSKTTRARDLKIATQKLQISEMVIGQVNFTSGAFKGPKLLPQGVPSAVSPLRSLFHEKFTKQKLFSYPKNYEPETVKRVKFQTKLQYKFNL